MSDSSPQPVTVSHRYAWGIRALAGSLIPLGWTETALPHIALTRPEWVAADVWIHLDYVFIGLFVAGFLGIVAIMVFLARSLPNNEKREDEITCALLPALLVVSEILLVIVPILELAARGMGQQAGAFDDWYGPYGGAGALTAMVIGGTQIAPLQFLWRDMSAQVRRTWIVVLVILPVCVMLPVPFEFNWTSLAVDALALLLSSVAVLSADGWRYSFEVNRQLVPGVLGGGHPEPTRAYDVENGVRRVGVALAGGGYRASLFALGALLYIHDACRATAGTRRKVVAVSSVSGGSITNGALAHGVELGNDTQETMDKFAQLLIRHTVSTGSMFGGEARFYYWLLLPCSGVISAILLGLALRNITWPMLWRSAIIPMLGCAIPVLSGLVSNIANDRVRNLVGWIVGVSCLAGPLAAMGFVFSHPLWRVSLGWISIAMVVVLGLGAVWSLRGELLRRNFERLLMVMTPSPVLKQTSAHAHHVFCATEVQLDESVYIAQDAIRSRSFPHTDPGTLRTSVAIRASAALPIAFPPVFIRGFERRFELGAVRRDRTDRVVPERMVLVDGGVRDNLGTGWFQHFETGIDELVVVSSATNRHRARLVSALPGLSELASLINLLNIPYNTRERNNRRAVLGELFGSARPGKKGSTRGALVHIEDSPFDLASMLKSNSEWKASPGIWLEQSGLEDWDINQLIAAGHLRDAAHEKDELLRRSDAVMEHLNQIEEKLPAPPLVSVAEQRRLSTVIGMRTSRTSHSHFSLGTSAEIAWWRRVEATSQVGTKLSRIEVEDAMNLLLQGFYLAMANLHITSGWPLSDGLDVARMEKLLDGLRRNETLSAIEAKHQEYAQLRAQQLEAQYTFVSIHAFNTMVRSEGDLERREIVALLGATLDGALKVVSIWLAPSARTKVPNPFEGQKVVEARKREFWEEVFGDLKRRGCESINVLHRKLEKHLWSGGPYAPFDDEFAKEYSDAAIVPQVKDFVTASSLWQAGTGDEARAIREDLVQLLLEPSEAEAWKHLERSRDHWSPRDKHYPKIYETWTEAWEKFIPLLSLPRPVRELILALDARLEEWSRGLRSNSERSGAFAREEDAVAENLLAVRKALKGLRISDLRARLAQWGMRGSEGVRKVEVRGK